MEIIRRCKNVGFVEIGWLFVFRLEIQFLNSFCTIRVNFEEKKVVKINRQDDLWD